jgi:HAMP domain-containing protein
MFKNITLTTKFTLFFSLAFISGILISGIVLSNALEHRAEDEINYRAQVLTQMINSVRNYTNNRITPLLSASQESQQKFIPETIPSFAAREVFEELRGNKEYTNYFYKDATINPTNLRDKADDFETSLIMRFRDNTKLQNLSGFRTLFGEQLFYSARPFAITQQSCLRCHSTPEQAPKSHVTSYGAENGYGWKLNDIITTQIIYIPANKLFENANKNFYLVMKLFILIFSLMILIINYLLKLNVIKPLKPMAQIAHKISTDTIAIDESKNAELTNLAKVAKRSDELGQLGKVFQKMVHEVYTREQYLKQQVQQLSIDIDQAKRERQVAEIADMEYFQNLRAQAQDIRSQWQDKNQQN